MAILQPRHISAEPSPTGGRIFKFLVPLNEQFSINATVHLEKWKPPVLKTDELIAFFTSLASFTARLKTARLSSYLKITGAGLSLEEFGEIHAAATVLNALAEIGETQLPECGYTVSLPCNVTENTSALPPNRFVWTFDRKIDEFLAMDKLPPGRLLYVIIALQENNHYYLGRGGTELDSFSEIPIGGGKLLLSRSQFEFSGLSPDYDTLPIEIIFDVARALVEKMKPAFNPMAVIMEGMADFSFFVRKEA